MIAHSLPAQQMAKAGESEDQLFNRSMAALTHSRLSFERSKIALLRIYSEYDYSFGANDSVKNKILATASTLDSFRTEKPTSLSAINVMILFYGSKVADMERMSLALKKRLNIYEPSPIGVPFFAVRTVRDPDPLPAPDTGNIFLVRYAEWGAFYTEQCAQSVEVIAEQFIAFSYLKKKQAVN